MKKMNRGRMYKFCIEYIKALAVRQEVCFLDPEIDCSAICGKMDDWLTVLEERMLRLLEDE